MSVPTKKSSLLFKMFVVTGVLFGVVILAIAVLCGPDQVRPLTVSSNAFAPILTEEMAKRVEEAMQEPDRKAGEAALMEVVRKHSFLPNMDGWPAPVQKKALQHCSDRDRLLLEYLMFPSRSRGMSDDAARSEQERMAKKAIALEHQYKDVLSHCTKFERAAMSKQFDAFWRAANTGFYADRGQWMDAAKCNTDRWDTATYYLRQGGIKGRGVLVMWSIWRRVHPEYFQ